MVNIYLGKSPGVVGFRDGRVIATGLLVGVSLTLFGWAIA